MQRQLSNVSVHSYQDYQPSRRYGPQYEPGGYAAAVQQRTNMTQREDALKFEQGRIKALQEERLHIQKKTFTKWINSFLQKARMEVDDLFVDLGDGRRLLKLLEIISGERLPRPNTGRMRVHKIENVNKSLSFLHTKKSKQEYILSDVALIIGLVELGVIPSHKRGFYCNDPGISLPFKGDTVSAAALMSTIFLLPLPVLLLSEWLFLNPDFLQRPRTLQAFYNTLWLYRSYLCGMFLNFCTVEVMKIVVGAPRPCFFEICQPGVARTCQGTEYVETFECTPSVRFSEWKQRHSYRSFFSGHSSLSFHCALFTAWYLQRRVFSWRHRVVFVVPFLQVALVVYASLCALTRVTDNMHHWWDVLTGVAVGVASAMYSALILCSNFSYAKRADDTLTERRDSSSMMFNPRRTT